MSEEPKAFVAVPQSSPSGHWAVQNTASGLYAASYCTEEDALAFAAAPDLLRAAKLFVAYDEDQDADEVVVMLAYADALKAAREAVKNEEHGLSRELSPEITGGAGPQTPPISDVTLMRDAWGALNFILAFYEPGQRYLDTNAWTQAEAGGRRARAALRVRLDALVAEEQVAGENSREANETITTLQAKIAGLEGELRVAREASVILKGDFEATETYSALRSDRDRARALAELERQSREAAEQALEGMRSAGQRVLKYGLHDDGTPMDWDEWVCFRAALNPTPQGGKPAQQASDE